ncbi:MAG TPA: threonine--tRNA ligase [Candidatus Altiarchaeales archaeon]|nr:threonine--tRNA ligase [Candidatus Altiarchaeales archaeon]
MRVLLLHCDYLAFLAQKKAVKNPEEITEKGRRLDECIVCFMAVEKADETNPSAVVDQLVKVIDEMAGQVKVENIVVYPYAHLSSDLSSLDVARKVLDETYEKVSKKYNALKAPFGWYKSFELRCKGHPLSELSRTITAEGAGEAEASKDVSEALRKEDKIKSFWHIMTPDGTLHDVDKFDYSNCPNLRKFAVYEETKSRAVDKKPPHIELMRKLELVDYEPASDAGNFRFYPKGKMMKALLEQFVTDRVLDYGGVEVETPLMYDFEHPTLSKYLNRFPARQYTITSDDKNFFMRFAACFGQFLMAHDATISYKNLPLRLYELARYAFRREKSGELAGIRRLRAFTMPDVHALCADLDQAMKEYKKRFSLSLGTVEGIGLEKSDIELAVRVTKDFYGEHKEFVTNLVKEFGKPALIEMWDERIFYFVLKYEFNFVDALDKASALSTDQIDVENGERYDIKFAKADGTFGHPIILHCSPSGAIERAIYALLEKAAMKMAKGETPTLPLWLCPTQVRLIPVSGEYYSFAEEIADKLKCGKIRADIDDRNESIGKRVRQASTEWVPYILVVGEKEKDSGNLSVRVRGVKEDKLMTLVQLEEELKKQVIDKPYRPLPLPKNISQRPIFVG